MAGEGGKKDAYGTHIQTLEDIVVEIKRATTLVSHVSFLGEFVVVLFLKPPTYQREKLLNTIAEILTDRLGSDYVFFNQKKNDFIFRRSGR